MSTTEGIPSQATPTQAQPDAATRAVGAHDATRAVGAHDATRAVGAHDATRAVGAHDATTRDVVSVRLPAAAAYLAVIRTTTASLAARLDFTLDEIEDLRIAVDEACCLLLADATPDAELTSAFEMSDGEIRVAISTHTAHARGPARESFAWTVLSALAGHVDATAGPDGLQTITLIKRRTHEVSA